MLRALRICLFFFERSGDHRDLHSFPTRRSSDLASLSRSAAHARASISMAGDWMKLSLGRSQASSPATASRSEEHTSELQSLRHLVCRLLLEKKKRQQCCGKAYSSPSPPIRASRT